jgi:hypothetical protein
MRLALIIGNIVQAPGWRIVFFRFTLFPEIQTVLNQGVITTFSQQYAVGVGVRKVPVIGQQGLQRLQFVNGQHTWLIMILIKEGELPL